MIAYVLAGFLYILKELVLFKKNGTLNIPKNLIVLGTALSWWVAIVGINSDFSFTMINVISHGVPYMALIWIYHHHLNGEAEGNGSKSALDYRFSLRVVLAWAPAFLLLLCFFAYIEEGFWAGFVWREHLEVFRPFAALPTITDANWLALLVPLLALPQSAHYVLDGFIWRVKDRTSSWSA
jgi:hypothetical protein